MSVTDLFAQRATLARSLRLLSEFRDEQPDPARFYGALLIAYMAAAALVLASVDLIGLAVGVEVMNALLLPIVLGFLFMLAIKTLPEEHKLKGLYAWMAGIVFVITAGFGIFSGIASLF